MCLAAAKAISIDTVVSVVLSELHGIFFILQSRKNRNCTEGFSWFTTAACSSYSTGPLEWDMSEINPKNLGDVPLGVPAYI